MKGRSFTTEVKLELFEMEKYVKINHSVSSASYKVWGSFFRRKALHGGTNFLGQIYRGVLYMGTNDLIMQGGVNGLEVSKVESS